MRTRYVTALVTLVVVFALSLAQILTADEPFCSSITYGFEGVEGQWETPKNCFGGPSVFAKAGVVISIIGAVGLSVISHREESTDAESVTP